MKFIDEVKVQVLAGSGGSGAVSWRREKYIPNGGPDGGNGGNGGAVIFVADTSKNTLIDFSYNPILRAGSGEPGGSNGCTGKTGEDCIKLVPVGTQIFFNDRLVADISKPGAKWVAARGGIGGKGNTFYKSATNQAPDYAQPGRPGEKFEFSLILKSVADVGLVGMPNVGKSSLVSAVTSAHPLIADYPFTTLKPSLGVVDLGENRKFVIADIPGLIPGAHLGKGLGIQFLRHIERTKILAQLIDLTQDETINQLLSDGVEISDQQILETTQNQFLAIDTELKLFSEDLLKKPRIIAFSKADLELQERAYNISKAWFEAHDLRVFLISSHTRDNLDKLTTALFDLKQ
jgi:GTPase